MEVKGKEIKGFSYADGVHWYWGEQEVAVIDEVRHEIEWCGRKHNYPDEVVKAIRNMIPKANGKWVIEARRNRVSATQGSVEVFINDKPIIGFEDKIICTDKGWISDTPDEDLGKFVISAFWHRLDDIYHYSDKAKYAFYPEFDKKN